MKSTRIPHAPSTALPDLAEFLAPFRVHFQRSEGPQALERYLTGLLTEHPNKNCDTLAQVVPGTSEQRLQGLLTAMVWDEDDLNRQRVERLLTLPTEGDAVLIFDDTGLAKQGQCSVGVARQYSGTLGKTASCQVTVNCHYAERTIAWPVATRLYLQESWADDHERRREPKSVGFHGPPFGSSKCSRTVTSHDPYSLPISGTVVSLVSRGCRITARRRVLFLTLGFRATRCTDPDGS
jgi:SRSO17 transposase